MALLNGKKFIFTFFFLVSFCFLRCCFIVFFFAACTLHAEGEN